MLLMRKHIFLFTVFAAVNFLFLVRQNKYMIQTLLNGSDAAGIFAFDDVRDLFWQSEDFFLHDLFILDDVDGDVVIDKTKDIQLQITNGTFHLDDVLGSHFVAAGIFDDGNGAVQLVQL